MMINKELFMQKALLQAKKAFKNDEVPVGAVVIKGNKIIASAYNKVESKKTQLAHAELIALKKAAKKLNDWRLDSCTIFVTLEPCAMCLAAIKISRVKRIIFGAKSKLFGFSVDKSFFFDKNKSHLEIEGGILENESGDLLRSFFKNKRNVKSECK